jgi:hypothetical protein
MIVYHYTTEDGLNLINKTGVLQISNAETTMDAAYGDGWYFTDISPDKCNFSVASLCWQKASEDVLKRTEYYLKYDIDSDILIKCREHVYVVYNADGEKMRFLEKSKNVDCPLKPCKNCKKYR